MDAIQRSQSAGNCWSSYIHSSSVISISLVPREATASKGIGDPSKATGLGLLCRPLSATRNSRECHLGCSRRFLGNQSSTTPTAGRTRSVTRDRRAAMRWSEEGRWRRRTWSPTLR